LIKSEQITGSKKIGGLPSIKDSAASKKVMLIKAAAAKKAQGADILELFVRTYSSFNPLDPPGHKCPGYPKQPAEAD